MSSTIFDKLKQRDDLLNDVRILIVGDVMVDRTYYHDPRVSKAEHGSAAPKTTEIFDVREPEKEVVGGAGSAARAIATFGKPILCGVVGCDREAERVAELLAEAGIRHDGLIRDGKRMTSLKLRLYVLDTNINQYREGHYRIDREQIEPIENDIEQKLLKYVKETIDEVDAIMICDFDKGVVTLTLAEEICKLAKERGKLVLVDPKFDWDKYRNAPISVMTPNEEEAKSAIGRSITKENFAHCCKELLFEGYPRCDKFAVTLASEGVLMIERISGEESYKGRFTQVRAVRAAHISSVRCGDVFDAFLLAGLVREFPFEECIALANLAAGLTCEKELEEMISVKELVSAVGDGRTVETPSEYIEVRSEKEEQFAGLLEDLGGTIDCESARGPSDLIVKQGTEYWGFLSELQKAFKSDLRKIFIQGESGSGKSEAVQAVARQLGRDMERINSPTDLADRRTLVEKVQRGITKGTLFFDELDKVENSQADGLLIQLEKGLFDLDGKEVPIGDALVVCGGKSPSSELLRRFEGNIWTVPALRKHREDIPYLIHQYIEDNNLEISAISIEALRELVQYDYREPKGENYAALQNVLRETADSVKVDRTNKIRLKNLPQRVRNRRIFKDDKFVQFGRLNSTIIERQRSKSKERKTRKR